LSGVATAGSTELANAPALPNLPASYDPSPLGRLYINTTGSAGTKVEFRSTDSAGLPVNPSFARDIIYRYSAEHYLHFNAPGATITSNLHVISAGAFRLILEDGATFAGDIRLTSTVSGVLIGITNPSQIAGQEAKRIEISGNIIGYSDTNGNAYGILDHRHNGTTVLSGDNRYGGTNLGWGTIIVTSPRALGSGGVQFNDTGGHLVFQGLPRTILPMAFFQDTSTTTTTTKGDITIIDSDLVFRRVPNHAAQSNAFGAYNSVESKFATLTLTGTSRLLAIPTGVSTSVLGGIGANITVGDHSTLILDAHTNTRPEITIPVKTLALDGGTLVLRPGSSLTVLESATLDGDAKITFTDGGIARLAYGPGSDPRLSTENAGDAGATIYTVPAGMTVATTITPTGSSGAGANRYLVVNQAGHPLKGAAMVTNAVGAVMDTISTRLSDHFLQPVADRPAAQRRWANTAWFRAFTRSGSRDTDGPAVPGHESDLTGAVLGLDATLGRNFVLGFHAGLADSTLDSANGTNLTAAQRFYGVHLAQRLGLLYFAADYSTSTADSSSRRYTEAGSTIASWDTACHSGGAELGAVLRLRDGLTLRPYAGFRYIRQKTAKHVETGPGAMEVPDFSDQLAQTLLGLRASQRFRVLKRDAAVDLFGSLKNATTRPRTTLEATFISDFDRTPVMLECPDYYGDTVSYGASLRVNVTKNTLLGLNFERETVTKGSCNTLGLLVAYLW
jgi:hypothetical protein